MAKVLVTGGLGFIGSHLVDRLILEGNDVVVLDDLSSGFWSNANPEARNLVGDVRVFDNVKQASEGCDVVYHLAEYIPNVIGHVIQHSVRNPRDDLDVCVGGTLNVLETARKQDASVVFTSTCAVYGNYSIPVREDFDPQPISPYGVAKLSAEKYCQMYSRTYGLKTNVVRFFNVYGARQQKYLLFDVVQKLKKNPTVLELIGDGSEVRDYIYIDDAIDMLLGVVQQNIPLSNIGTGIGHTTSEVVQMICNEMQLNPEIMYTGAWKGNIQRVVSGTRLLEPKIPLRDGLKLTLDYWYAI